MEKIKNKKLHNTFYYYTNVMEPREKLEVIFSYIEKK
jgi:hypothetical protein